MVVKNMGSGDKGFERRCNGVYLDCRHFVAVDNEAIFSRIIYYFTH